MASSRLVDVLGASAFEVVLAGVTLPLSAAGRVSIRHGRSDADDAPDASTLSTTLRGDLLPALPGIGDPLTVRLGASARNYLGLPTVYGPNLFPYATFEAPAAEILAAPTVVGYFTPTRAIVADAHTGSQALQFTTTGGSSGEGATLRAPLGTGVPFGTVCKVGVWAKGPAGRSLRVRSWIERVNAYTAVSQAKTQVTVALTGSWQYIEPPTFTVAATGESPGIYTNLAGDTSFRPCVSMEVTGATTGVSVQIDDVSIQTLTDASAWEAVRPRFVGQVTDVAAAPGVAGVTGPALVSVVAAGSLARLGRLVVGDTPWPAERDGARAARILALAAANAGVTVGPVDVGTVDVLGRDVDAQPALELLTELAGQAGSLLVQRRDGTLEWHDANHRRGTPAVLAGLAAANILTGSRWEQTLAGAVNDLTVGYGTGDPQATVRVQDAPSVAAYGRLAGSTGTALATLTDATVRAGDVVGRRSRPRWRVDGLTVELLRTVSPSQAASLAGAEVGSLLTLTGLPETGPFSAARMFVEGWSEEIAPDGWTLALDVTEYGLTGPSPRWVDVPATVKWSGVPASTTWLAAVSWYAGDANAGRYVDRPASRRWSQESATWATA